MKTYLVEAYSPDIKFEQGSLIIALTPKVCYQLDKEGIGYSIIEDYYDEVELSNQVEDYSQSVFQWIDSLDRFLLDNVKGLDSELGTIYRWYLKRMILDPLYVRCYTLRRLFDRVKPSEVTFIAPTPGEPDLNYRFEHSGRSLYAQVIPILCGESGIPLTPVYLEPGSKELKISAKSTGYEDFNTRLKRILSKNTIVRRLHIFYKRLHFIYRCSKSVYFARRVRQEKLNIFMLKTGYIGEDFVIDAMTRGNNVYLLSDNHVLRYSCLGARGHLDLKVECNKVTDLNSGCWEAAANLLEGHDLIQWINAKCQMKVSEIVLPKLRHFVLRVCPELVRYFKVFTDFYKRDKIDILFTPSISPLSEYAALAAASHYPRVLKACLRHGDAVYDDRTWYTTELQNFDVLISSHAETKQYFSTLAKAVGSPARIYSSPHRLLDVKNIGCLREKGKSNTIEKNRIIYLTGIMMWDTRRMNGLDYPDTWYYKFQKSLVEYFSTRKEFTFIWKGLPQAEETNNPIPNFIEDSNFSNIEFATNPFTQHLLSAGRVICDYPSTGFYEAVIAGVPVMSLYPRSLIMRKSAVDYFGPLLKSFSDISEAIKHIEEFLSSDPALYKKTIDMEGSRLLDILEKAAGGRKND